MTLEFRSQIEKFISGILDYIKSKGVSLELFEIDHLAYKTSSSENYELMRKEFEQESFIYQSIISNRRIAISKFNETIIVQNKEIKYIEIFEPKPSKATLDKLDHIEIISRGLDYEAFVNHFKENGFDLTYEDKGYDRFYSFSNDYGHEVKLSKQKLVDKIYNEEMI